MYAYAGGLLVPVTEQLTLDGLDSLKVSVDEFGFRYKPDARFHIGQKPDEPAVKFTWSLKGNSPRYFFSFGYMAQSQTTVGEADNVVRVGGEFFLRGNLENLAELFENPVELFRVTIRELPDRSSFRGYQVMYNLDQVLEPSSSEIVGKSLVSPERPVDSYGKAVRWIAPGYEGWLEEYSLAVDRFRSDGRDRTVEEITKGLFRKALER